MARDNGVQTATEAWPEAQAGLADVRVERATVGAGNAAAAPSHLPNPPLVIRVPALTVVRRAAGMSHEPAPCVGEGVFVAQRLLGELDGQVLLALPLSQACSLLALLSPGSPADDLQHDFGKALLQQVAALLTAAYLAALRIFLSLRVTASLPQDVQFARLDTALAAAAAALGESHIVVLKTAVHTPENTEDAVACVLFVLSQHAAALLERRARALLRETDI